MKRQIELFLTAVMFYTRIPVPRSLGFSEDRLNRSTRYFTVIGWLVGGWGAAVFYGLHFLFPVGLAVFLSMLATILLTGAFHEDGFADFCDGFGGGCTREGILGIMKDSRIGTYGTLGLIGILGSKFLSVQALPPVLIPRALLAAHAFSRMIPVLLIFTSRYSREDALSKTKPVGRRGKLSDLLVAAVAGFLPLLLFPWQLTVLLIPFSLLLSWMFKHYTEQKIGGYTGDCLGALQQLTEIFFYLCLLTLG